MVPTLSLAAATMTSREIAELTGKLHSHVLRDIRNMLDELGLDQSNFGSVYLAGNGEQRTQFVLDEDLTNTLVSGYSIPMRHKVMVHWRQLREEKKQQAAPAIPTSFREALLLAAAQQEHEGQQEARAGIGSRCYQLRSTAVVPNQLTHQRTGPLLA